MSALEAEIKKLVKETVTELYGAPTPEHIELISIDKAAEICDCDRSIISSLVEDSPANNFPATRLSSRTVRIDKARLIQWLYDGGLIGQD